MITEVTPFDAKYITDIYNYYVKESVATFDTEEWNEEKMKTRIEELAGDFPYLVYRQPGGEVVGYCYAHPWKEKDAYKFTLETTIYISPKHTGKGIGMLLMSALIKECKKAGVKTLISCITQGNESSFKLHEKLGFKKVSHFEKVGIKFGKWLDVIDYELIL